MKSYESLTVTSPIRKAVYLVRLEKVAYVPDLAVNLFSSVAAHKKGVDFVTDDDDMSLTLFDD